MNDIADIETPDDLIPAFQAGKIACCTPRTLARWHEAGRIKAYRREGYSARFYSRREIERLRPRLVRND